MAIFLDWLLIIISTFIVIKIYKNIIFKENCSIANYVIAILYVFCVLPIILNYIIGIPEYSTIYWYKVFIKPMNNSLISIIYDLYVGSIIISLYFLFARKVKNIKLKSENTLTSIYQNNKIIAFILIILPLIVILASGTAKNYIKFNVAASRGFSEDANTSLVTPSLLISMLTYFSVVFKNKITKKKIIISILYFFLIIWISGKRFMIANILALLIFYLVNMSLSYKARKKIFKIIPGLLVLLVSFSAFYLVKVRPLSDTSADSVYEMLRVDFGRDDVIKYVIDKEILENVRILDYRGESFLSLVLFMIPRKIWPTKPYPHYMYLTGSILGLEIYNLPAGTTPSLLEMTICNFGVCGFIIGELLILILCYLIDKCNDIDRKAIYLILFIVLLTQSMDVYIVAIFFLILMRLLMIIYKNKRIKFVIR